MIKDIGAPRAIGFLFVPGFALMSAAAAVEPLRAANLLSGRTLYEVHHYSTGGGPVPASCGAVFETEASGTAGARTGIMFVVAGGDPMTRDDPVLFGQLRRLAARGIPLGGISGGGVLLARAGLMEKRRFTVHWEHVEALRETSPDLLMERRLFVIDRDRATCAGGVAPLDMMHAMIRSDHGAELARRVSDWFIHTGIRQADDPQPTGRRDDGKAYHRSVAAALALMENHIADPLNARQVARLCGASERQLQRRFGEETGTSLMRAYLDLRLAKADELVCKTRLSMLDIALATGFNNAAHFAHRYRSRFGLSPSERRNGARSGNAS
ncbi:GlxA family transcriptional regulator [Zhengella mangrovi]|nr:GlxA family transcriptional regulator [Zhengella mangrovi]